MSIVLVGGMDRLGVQYRREAERLGMDLRIFSQAEQGMGGKIKNADAMVIFTNKISHRAKNEAMNAAKANGIPLYMHHSCGVCTFRECIRCLRVMTPAGRPASPSPAARI